jgi:hypothetical protein
VTRRGRRHRARSLRLATLGEIYRADVFTSTDNTVVLPNWTRVDAAVFYLVGARIAITRHFPVRLLPLPADCQFVAGGRPRQRFILNQDGRIYTCRFVAATTPLALKR